MEPSRWKLGQPTTKLIFQQCSIAYNWVMMNRKALLVFLLLEYILMIAACRLETPLSAPVEISAETKVTILPLSGDIDQPRAEISGLAWYKDTLVLLPQYPERFDSSGDGVLFGIQKSQIQAYLGDNSGTELVPAPIILEAPGLIERIPGFEGFEAIAFDGDRVYLTIESKPGRSMLGYVVRGEIAPDLSVITLALDSLEEILPQAKIDNFSDEALLISSGKVLTFYEAWGPNVNPEAVGHIFDLDLSPSGTWPLENIEYRITDVTSTDDSGRFWAINYLYPGDEVKLEPAEDELAILYGEGKTHAETNIVERLVEFRIDGERVIRTQSPPIQLELMENETARNWEGIVRLEPSGFLVVTDQYPETILGFVPNP